MQIWADRYLILLSIGVVILSIGMGYQFAKTTRLKQPIPQICTQSAPFFLQTTQLPSVIPHFRVAAQRHVFLPIDLRRADLVLGMRVEPEIMTPPLLDKVLFVPKKFKSRS